MSAVYPWGPDALSFSTLKHVAESPADFLHACTNPIEATPSMRLGTLVHWYLLGGPEHRRPQVAPARNRRNKFWDIWAAPRLKADPRAELYTEDEAEEAETIADAVRTAPHNHALYQEYLAGAEYELPLSWEMKGIPFRTRGVDAFHRAHEALTDFKTARSSHPRAFKWQATSLHYPVQTSIYAEGCRQNGRTVTTQRIFAVCTKAPYVATVFNVPAEVQHEAAATMWRWIDTVKACLETGLWPGYETKPVDLEMRPQELGGLDGLEEEIA